MSLVRGLLIGCAVLVALGAGSSEARQVAPISLNAPANNSSQSTAATSKPKVLIDASLRNDPTATVVWIAYGVGLAMNHPKLDLQRAAGLHAYVPTFDADLLARKNQIVVWNQIKAKDASVSNTYMSELEKINEAGFLQEYVWEYYKQPGWVEPSGLRLSQFDVWRQQNLPGLRAETLAHLGI